MLKIALINLPFADVNLPSIALTQLKYVTEQANPSDVDVRITNLNHEFAHYVGQELYQEIALGLQHHHSGLGDWLFRQAAFPTVPGNSDEYFNRYYPRRDSKMRVLRNMILEKRLGMQDWFARMIEKYGIGEADLIGLTSMFQQNMACFAFARLMKKINPRVTVVMGGANCEHPMGREIVDHVDVVDYIFSGPALISFPEFVGFQARGTLGSCHQIDGVFSRKNQTAQHKELPVDAPQFRETASVGPIGKELDINVWIPLDYSEFLDSFERFFPNSATGPTLTFETSRGCWWGERSHCTFCGLNGMSMNYRSMQPARALELFRSLFAYSSRCSRLACVDNILPKTYLKDVLPYLDTPSNLSIFYEVKADLSEEDMQILARARVMAIQPGVEALASSTLKLMKKGTTAFQNLALLKHCVFYDIEPEWNLLVGFPGEKEEVFQKYLRDLPLLVHLPPPSGVFPVRFDRFSPYFMQAKAYGLRLQPFEYYSMTYPFPESSLENLAYFFMDLNYDADYFVGMVKWLDRLQKQVEAWRASWHDAHGAHRPRLEFRRDAGREIVLDTRGGKCVQHVLSECGMKLLKHLNSQSSFDRIVSAFAPVPPHILEGELNNLKDCSLIFEENGRFLNLVVGAGSSLEVNENQSHTAEWKSVNATVGSIA